MAFVSERLALGMTVCLQLARMPRSRRRTCGSFARELQAHLVFQIAIFKAISRNKALGAFVCLPLPRFLAVCTSP